jgi:Short C-terminal domain
MNTMADQMATQHAGAIQAAQTMDFGKQMAMGQRINPADAMLGSKPPGGSDTRIMKLEQLSAMHAAGAFTDEEFAAKKAAVLAED